MTEQKRQTTAKSKKAALSMRGRVLNKRIGSFLFFLLVVVVAFVCGFLVRNSIPLMNSLGFPVDEGSQPSLMTSSKQKNIYNSIALRVSDVEDILSTYSFDEVKLEAATNSMLDGLMESTGDPYAVYFNEERYETYMKENSERQFSGVGVLFGDYNGRAYVIDVLEGSQAQADGVSQGDFVEAINGDSDKVWSATEVIGALAKDDGDRVIITWMRPISLDATTGEEFTTTLEVHEYDMENVTYELREEVGYIKLRQITANSSELVSKALIELKEQGAKSYILDITDNPGGFLTQSLDIASDFIPSGVLVGIKTKDGTTTRSASGNPITDAPLVVMVNNYTSGVAEVLAAALQDNQRATIVGQRTMGKGSVQVTRELPFGGAVRYTAAYYIAPNKQDINGIGITPNIEVANQPDNPENFQLLVALDTAKSLIPNN